MSNETDDVKFTTINLSAEIKKIWGEKWNAPETSYEFSNGRKFELRTGDAAIYETSPDFEAS
jgi:hypothetical protein